MRGNLQKSKEIKIPPKKYALPLRVEVNITKHKILGAKIDLY